MKRFLSLLLTLMLVVSLTACANKPSSSSGTNTTPSASPSTPSSNAPAEKYVMRIAHAMSTDHAYHIWATKFAEELKKLVGDSVEVQIFPNGQLGSETESLQSVQMGMLDSVICGRHSQIDPRMDVLNLPFIFKDAEHIQKVIGNGTDLEKLFEQIFLDKGYVCLGLYDTGFRLITSNKPIKSVADLKGLDIRVPNTPALMAAFKAWGANPTPLDFGEVYTALQQGVVKAQENPPELIYTSKFYEVQKYLNITNHSTIPGEFLVGKKYWDTLPEDIQKAIREAANKAKEYMQPLVLEKNKKFIDELQAKGMTVVTDIDRDSFVPAARESYKQFYNTIGEDLIQKVIDAGK
ncbi:hypothetical protein DXT63_01510 [Thermoanaerobacteraceae bacterium SP2]|nr:hypothetical protein DXT63_01510 [Thermoanaerobacteraceae bacterium SP2]